MSRFNPLGFGPIRLDDRDGPRVEHVIVRHPLHRVLAFTRRSIDDVINDPIARHEVVGYFKLHKWVQRQCEIGELERQWGTPR